MEKLLYLLPVLACPVGMGLMMWFMMRTGQRRPGGDDLAAKEAELARLRADVDQLRAAERDRAGADREPRP